MNLGGGNKKAGSEIGRRLLCVGMKPVTTQAVVFQPAAEPFGLDADENFRADVRSVDHIRGVLGVQEL